MRRVHEQKEEKIHTKSTIESNSSTFRTQNNLYRRSMLLCSALDERSI